MAVNRAEGEVGGGLVDGGFFTCQTRLAQDDTGQDRIPQGGHTLDI